MINTALDEIRKEQQKTSGNILKGERFLSHIEQLCVQINRTRSEEKKKNLLKKELATS
jgi:hypothetical protein